MREVVIYQPTLRRLADREELGRAAAADVANAMRRRLQDQPSLRMIFASAPSQESTLRALADQPGIDWTRVTAFHMDEYLGLPHDAPQRFGTWLQTVLFDHVPIGTVELIDPGDNPQRTVAGYAELLAAEPIDLVCLGIGVNGHLAFNDPPADLADAAAVKVVELDEVSRQQQVDDGCFSRLADVPTQAITLTIPTLLSAREIFCMAPGSAKRSAVTRALNGPVTGDLPASALRTHQRCTVYVDAASAPDGGQ
jgi:glucosamine-6-phosphate deaminase